MSFISEAVEKAVDKIVLSSKAQSCLRTAFCREACDDILWMRLSGQSQSEITQAVASKIAGRALLLGKWCSVEHINNVMAMPDLIDERLRHRPDIRQKFAACVSLRQRSSGTRELRLKMREVRELCLA